MKKFQTTVSLEPMTSRLPSVLPAYKDNKLYFFDSKSIEEREGLYTTNYGMIPINICLNKANGCGNYSFACGGHVLSWERFSEYFHFFTEYYNLLQKEGHCGIVYSSATQYYDHEYYSKYASQLKYGVDRDTYVELDNLFAERGGCINVTTGLCSGKETIISIEDNGIFKFFKDYIVPSFTIPQDLVDYWNVTYLFYPDVIKWITWFQPRVKLYQDITEEYQCSASTNCCDCVEYIDRGGEELYNKLVSWYNSVQDKILSSIDNIQGCYKPSFLKQIEITNSIFDLGMESEMVEEYETGIDYRHYDFNDSSNENTLGGTVVSYSGTSLQLKRDGSTGFDFDERLLEKYYDEKAFDSYTDKYVKNNPNEFTADHFKYYAFNDNNEKVTGNTTNEVVANLSIKYPYTKINAMYHENTLFDIQTSEYGYYNLANGRQRVRVLIHREHQTNTPYIIINNRIIYADFEVTSKGEGIFTFPAVFVDNTSNTKWSSSRVVSGATFDYIEINGTPKSVNECKEYTDGVPYYQVNGYVAIDETTVYAYNNKSGVTFDEYGAISQYKNSTVSNGNIIVPTTSYTIYSADEMIGETSSKLSNLRSLSLLSDDAGNTLEAIAETKDSKGNTYFIQPIEGSQLESPYQIGNTANVTQYKYTIEDLSVIKELGLTKNYYVGDIITDMKFYYVYYPNSDSNETKPIVFASDGINTVVSSTGSTLTAIQQSTAQYEKFKEYYPNTTSDDTIKCDITYYIGATLYRDSAGTYKLLNNGTIDSKLTDYLEVGSIKGDNGIKYTETIEFVKDVSQYYLRQPSASELAERTISNENSTYYAPLSYPVITYRMVQQEKTVEDFSGGTTSYPIANFYCKLNTYNKDSNTWRYKDYDCETYNNMQVTPTIRREYANGVASIANVDADIFIDRGSNAAFEQHLKLGEVTSLEALENYANGYFKFMEN